MALDYSEFDRLSKDSQLVHVTAEPTYGGIRSLPTLDVVARTVEGRLREIHRNADWLAARAGVSRQLVDDMTAGQPVPMGDALRVFDELGIKAVRVPPEYLDMA